MNYTNKEINTTHVNTTYLISPITPTSLLNTQRVPAMMMKAESKTLMTTERVIIGSFTSLGFCFTTSLSTGSTPRLQQRNGYE